MILGACTGRQLDIIISCFTGYYDDGGLYIDDMHTVGANPLANHPLLFPVERFCAILSEWIPVWKYLRTPSKFWFDLVTSVPFSYYDLILYEASLFVCAYIYDNDLHDMSSK